ncbi:uncharacterized protein LOC114523765 [Dendronephthya gigantea]|uniref:uncharacterized protein LOC114523765 n=1 Tax=Dendronephthya gigantea TaxID=151771 RepID=UPI00106B58C0|nr:uncharacterized protein LOC114523765 [Dendronephthya gigantea]
MADDINKCNYYISSLLGKLQSSSLSSVQKSLISLSRATRKPENVKKLREEGGIKSLLSFLQASNKKTLDMAVSALANCAMERKCRNEIKQLNGLAPLCNILASLADISILTRVTRALANLSQDVSIANVIVGLKAVPVLLSILASSNDANLLQNSLRALRIMSASFACMKELEEKNGIRSLVELLNKENCNETQRCCLQTLLELSKVGRGLLATQFQEHGAVEAVSQLSYSDDKDLAERCIDILCTLTKYFSVRVSVGTMGGIQAFFHQIRNRSSLLPLSIEGVCMCCREAVNRNKVRSCGGLEVLLDILRCPQYSDAFDNILGAFACFTYDDIALKSMIASGLIPILVAMLRKLLFSENAAKNGTEEQNDNLPTSKDETQITPTPQKRVKYASSTIQDSNIHSNSTFQPISSSTTPISSAISDSIVSRPLILPSLHYANNSASPPSCLSPNLSPELRVPFPASHSPESARSSSPMVYSPSGSEAGEGSSSCSDHEEDAVEVAGTDAQITQDFTAVKSDGLAAEAPASNECTMSGNTTSGFEEEERGTPCDSQSRMKDDSTTHSGDTVVTASEKQHSQPSQQEDCPFLPSSSKRRTRGPLLPGASFSEYHHLFLPDENVFSADQPSPRKRPEDQWSRRKSWQSYAAARGHSKTPRGVSTSSNPYYSHSSGLEGMENKIIFLLSRFGQMPHASDVEALTSSECIQTLLDYLCFSKNRDPRCRRLFSRLAWDRKYFETFVLIMFPGAVYRQLVRGLYPGYLFFNQSKSSTATGIDGNAGKQIVLTSEPITARASDNVAADVMRSATFVQDDSLARESPKDIPRCDSNSELNSPANLRQSSPDRASTSCSKKTSSNAEIDDVIKNNPVGSKLKSSLQTTPGKSKENVLQYTANPTWNDDTEIIGTSLLSVLSTQASTSFGEGILAHLLLRGTKKQKEACALSLPYLCKTSRLKQKLLVNLEGLMQILSLLCNSTNQIDIIRAVNSITYLIANSALKMYEISAVFIAKNTIPRGYRVVDLLCIAGIKRVPVCFYHNNHQTPFDVVMKVETGESIEVHRSVLCKLSEVFSAMFSSHFMEGHQSEIILKDLNHSTLQFLVHYAYGCCWSLKSHFDVCPLLEQILSSDRFKLDFDFLLNLLACADRFLLGILKKQCENLMMFSLSAEHVTEAYLTAVLYNTPRLRVRCLQFIFLGDIELNCVYKYVVKLLQSQERDRVIEDFKNIALDCCTEIKSDSEW